jgi:NADH-quinone oxidoreductase subunit I
MVSKTIPRITIDRAKCTKPMECRKCMQVCPHAVFAASPTKIEKFKLSTEYALRAPYRAYCIVCNECMNVCPTKAIDIKLESQ